MNVKTSRRAVLFLLSSVMFAFSYVLADTMKEPSSFSINGESPYVYENVKKKLVKIFQVKVEESDKDISISKDTPILIEIKKLCKKATEEIDSHKNGRVWVASDDKRMSIYFDISKDIIVDILLNI
jgi:hypothetical protein